MDTSTHEPLTMNQSFRYACCLDLPAASLLPAGSTLCLLRHNNRLRNGFAALVLETSGLAGVWLQLAE